MSNKFRFEFHDLSGIRISVYRNSENSHIQILGSHSEEVPFLIYQIELQDLPREIENLNQCLSKSIRSEDKSDFLDSLDNYKLSDKSIASLINCLQKSQDENDGKINACDVIVVGGGAAGLATVLALRKTGLKTILISDPASDSAFSYSAGKIIPSALEECKGVLGDITRYSMRLWNDYATENNIELQHRGHLSLAYKKDQASVLSEKVDLLKTEYPYEIINLENGIGSDFIGPLIKEETILVTWQKDFISIDPGEASSKILSEIPIDSKTQSRAKELIVSNGRAIGVSTTAGNFYADSIVAATGTHWNWLPKDLRPPIAPMAGTMAILETEEKWEQPCITAPNSLIVPMGDKKVWIGVSAHLGDGSRKPLLEDIANITSNAIKVCPELSKSRIVRIGNGVRPHSTKGLPVIGESSLPGLYIAAGAGRAGVILMPLIGELISCAILKEKHKYKEICRPQ